MGWGKWFTDDRGDQVRQKHEKTDTGSRDHFLRSTGRDRNDHTHVVVNKDSSGKATSAFSSERRRSDRDRSEKK